VQNPPADRGVQDVARAVCPLLDDVCRTFELVPQTFRPDLIRIDLMHHHLGREAVTGIKLESYRLAHILHGDIHHHHQTTCHAGRDVESIHEVDGVASVDLLRPIHLLVAQVIDQSDSVAHPVAARHREVHCLELDMFARDVRDIDAEHGAFFSTRQRVRLEAALAPLDQVRRAVVRRQIVDRDPEGIDLGRKENDRAIQAQDVVRVARDDGRQVVEHALHVTPGRARVDDGIRAGPGAGGGARGKDERCGEHHETEHGNLFWLQE
jgi:hypothetical protein